MQVRSDLERLAYDEGYRAGSLPWNNQDENPYITVGPLWREWDAGFEDGRYHSDWEDDDGPCEEG